MKTDHLLTSMFMFAMGAACSFISSVTVFKGFAIFLGLSAFIFFATFIALIICYFNE